MFCVDAAARSGCLRAASRFQASTYARVDVGKPAKSASVVVEDDVSEIHRFGASLTTSTELRGDGIKSVNSYNHITSTQRRPAVSIAF